MTVVRVVSFNVNQFSKPQHQLADLTARMADADVIGVQESVKLDLVAFVQSSPEWQAFQIRNGDNDGHANTAVLYRKALGPVQDTVDLFVGDTPGTRRRFLAAVKIGGVWYGSLHLFPSRDKGGIPEQLRRAGAWRRTHPGAHVWELDKNQAKPADLEDATGLTWHGIDIDGFLTNLPLKGLAEFPKGFSDHPGVHAAATVATPQEHKPVKKTRLQQIIADLRHALAVFKAKGQTTRAKRARAAVKALKPTPKPTAPAPDPKPEPAILHYPAITAARTQSHAGPQFGVGECLMRVRGCYGIAAREHDAAQAWQLAKVKHPQTDPNKIPRGYPVFWTGGSKGFGHIAISAGNGKCWSTDIKRPGFFDYADIADIHAKWGLTLVGYTDDINGVTATITA